MHRIPCRAYLVKSSLLWVVANVYRRSNELMLYKTESVWLADHIYRTAYVVDSVQATLLFDPALRASYI